MDEAANGRGKGEKILGEVGRGKDQDKVIVSTVVHLPSPLTFCTALSPMPASVETSIYPWMRRKYT